MIVSVHQPDSYLWNVIDNDTGKEIRRVQYADDKKGIYTQLKVDANGDVALCKCPKCGESNVIEETKYGNIKLVRKSKEVTNG